MFEDLDFPRFPEEFHWLEGAVCGAYGLGDIRKIAIGLEALADDENRMLFAGDSSISEIVSKAFFAYERKKIYEEFPELKLMLALASNRTKQEKIIAGILAMPIDERALLSFLPIQSMIDKALHSHEKRAVLNEFPSLKTILEVSYSKVDQDKILTGLASIPTDERWRLNSDFVSIKDIVDKALTAFEKNGRLGNVFSSSAISEFVSDKRNALSRYSDISSSPIEDELVAVKELNQVGNELLQPAKSHNALKSGFLGIELHHAIEANEDTKILEILRSNDFTIDVLKATHAAAKILPKELSNLENETKEINNVCRIAIKAMAEVNTLFSDEEKEKIKAAYAKKKSDNPALSADAIYGLLVTTFGSSKPTIRRIVLKK